MQLFITIFFFTLSLNIFLNNILVCILTNCIYIIPICPELTTPQLIFYFRMKSKKFFCCYTFYCLNYSFYRHHWNTLYQKMNMIFINPNFNKVYFKSKFNIFANFYQTVFNCLRQNTSPIFYRTNQMIQQQILIMPFMNMFTHKCKYNTYYSNPTPQQS